MTAPIPLRLDPADYPPPHGPDHAPCSPCDRLRHQLGVVRLRTDAMNHDTDIIVGPTDESRAEFRSGFAMSSADWSRRSAEAARRGDFEKARTFALVARVADSVAKGGLT